MLVLIYALIFFLSNCSASFLGFKIDDHSPFEEISGSKGKATSSQANCMICREVFLQKFDYQNVIDQSKCDPISQKFPISTSECIVLSKNVAYRFFDNGGDSFFEPNLGDKVKACRNSIDFDKSPQCQESWPTVCDLLLANPSKECEAIAKETKKQPNPFGIEESKATRENFPRFKETISSSLEEENSKLEAQLKV